MDASVVEQPGGPLQLRQPRGAIRTMLEQYHAFARVTAHSAFTAHELGNMTPPVPLRVHRCSWPKSDLDISYHDAEWGVPVHDDAVLFEFLTLEGAQAGLSWSTILQKRDGYRRLFANFDVKRVARFTPARIDRIMLDPGIVRHRGKLESTVSNAKAFLEVQKEHGSFDRYLWQFVGGEPRVNRRRAAGTVPARTAESDALSRDLKQRGFRFVGSTICYAFMQAVGMVNDHLVDCFRWRELAGQTEAAASSKLTSSRPSR
jgi:DNA-3-methyladenine glycosylase I